MNVRRTLAVLALTLLVGVWGFAAASSGASTAASGEGLSLSASPSATVWGGAVTLSAQGAPAGATLTLSRRYQGASAFTAVATGVADAAGAAQWVRHPSETVTYRVDVAGDAGHDPAAAEADVVVHARVLLRVSASRPVIEGETVRCTVDVRPLRPGEAVRLERRTDAGWEALAETTLRPDSTARLSFTADDPGKLVIRAVVPETQERSGGASTAWRTTVYDRRNPYGVPASYPHLILVDRSQYKLYYYERGAVVRVFDCVLGRPSLPTPVGHFKIYAKDPHMGGPYGPYRMRYLGLYAIHVTDEPWLLQRWPRNYSHGCTRLSNANITWLYQRVHVGTPVWNVP